MARTAADVLADRLIDWGVRVVFGLPGDGINGIMEALRTRQDRISFVQVRHEEAAAFMACGYAKYTGRLGVCLATSGPGAIHLLNGLYDAKMDGAPVLAITGQTYHDLIGRHYQQEVDLRHAVQGRRASTTSRCTAPAHVAVARRRRLPRGAVAAAASRTSPSRSTCRNRRSPTTSSRRRTSRATRRDRLDAADRRAARTRTSAPPRTC